MQRDGEFRGDVEEELRNAPSHVFGVSHRRAGRDMAQRILAAGYRRIGFIGKSLRG